MRMPCLRRVHLAAAFALTWTCVGNAPAAPPDRELTLATFNIHHAEGTDGVLDLGRVADAVRGADVVAFQEVDVRFRERSRFVDQAAELARALGGRYAFGPNLLEGEGQYGVALVSKFPIRSSRNHRLPHAPGREASEPRGLLEVELDVDGRPLRVFVTHLSHDSRPERLLQVDRLRELVMGAAAASRDLPWVLMGDLNFRPDSDEYARLTGRQDERAAEATGPRLVDTWTRVGRGAGPTHGLRGAHPGRIDYIFVSPSLAPGLVSARVVAETIASDHQPVVAVIRLPPPGP